MFLSLTNKLLIRHFNFIDKKKTRHHSVCWPELLQLCSSVLIISRLKHFQPTPEIRTQKTNKSKGFAETFISSQANSKLANSKLLFGPSVRFVANDSNYSRKPSTHQDYTPALHHRFSWHHQPISQQDNASPPLARAPFIANWNSRIICTFWFQGRLLRVPPLPHPRIAVIQYVNVKADAPLLTDLRKEQLKMFA